MLATMAAQHPSMGPASSQHYRFTPSVSAASSPGAVSMTSEHMPTLAVMEEEDYEEPIAMPPPPPMPKRVKSTHPAWELSGSTFNIGYLAGMGAGSGMALMLMRTQQ